ncbi:hypothetical protein ONZ51_g3533 [Trametes cubensis]|uniref:F-box domain-containing protein n=1 Tax=Trametes cubensis TaxID=1111947 RepID=A0AAD7XFJ7_9APHY|nr:hypothetical protein ONZ51_g3533 [Trametes cubensis]
MQFLYRPPAPLQEDLLHLIFEHAPCPETLAYAALVCRAWVFPAQAALYKDIQYSPLAPCRKDALLARTLRSRPHLLRFVRRLSLVTLWTHSPTPELCDWIALIPMHHLRDFLWTWERGHLLPSFLSLPAVQTTRNIDLRGRLYTLSVVQSVLDLPHLESLSLELSGDEQGTLACSSTKLRHLGVVAHGGHSPPLDKLLAVVGHCIKSLRIVSTFGDDLEGDSALVSCILTHCVDLKSLDIAATGTPKPPFSAIEALIRQFVSLEHLRCSTGAVPDIFGAMPRNLQSLQLPLALSQEEPLLDYLEHETASLSLDSLELISGRDVDIDRITKACRARQVRLRRYSE